MSVLYPAFLLGAVLVAIPVVLHLLRRDVAPPVPFTAVRLLRQSPIERTRRRRLRDVLLLAARVAALLLLAGAFARPYFAGDAGAGGIRIVAIDRSFSMGAPGQFERALARARAAIDGAAAGDRVAVVAFDDRAEVVAAVGSAADARAALEGLRAGYGGTRYGSALARAVELADGAAGSLVLISDLQRAGWDEQARALLPHGLTLEIADVGAPPANLAVTGVRREAGRFVATIRNAGTARDAEARALGDGRVVASARFTAPADGSIDVTLPYRGPDAGSLAVTIDDAIGFQADNARFISLEPPSRAAVLVVTSGAESSGFYLARAVEAAASDDPGDGFELQLVSGAQATAAALGDLSRVRAIVILSTRGLDRRARGPIAAFVRGGGGIFVAASPDVEPTVLSNIFEWQPALPAVEQPIERAALSVTDLRHPIFLPFGAIAANLGHVRFERAWRVRADPAAAPWNVVARFTSGAAALVERREGQGRVVLFASDLDRRWNDFPLHPSFVPFAVEAVRYVAGGRDDARAYVVGRVPDGVRAEPGVYRYATRTIAVNVDPRESASGRMSDEEFRAMVEVVAAAAGPAELRAHQAESRQSYWRYALMLMLGVLVLESAIGKA